MDDGDKLRERVRFVHPPIGTDAIAERYIEGCELYVGVFLAPRDPGQTCASLRHVKSFQVTASRCCLQSGKPALQTTQNHVNGERAGEEPGHSAGDFRVPLH